MLKIIYNKQSPTLKELLKKYLQKINNNERL